MPPKTAHATREVSRGVAPRSPRGSPSAAALRAVSAARPSAPRGGAPGARAPHTRRRVGGRGGRADPPRAPARAAETNPARRARLATNQASVNVWPTSRSVNAPGAAPAFGSSASARASDVARVGDDTARRARPNMAARRRGRPRRRAAGGLPQRRGVARGAPSSAGGDARRLESTAAHASDRARSRECSTTPQTSPCGGTPPAPATSRCSCRAPGAQRRAARRCRRMSCAALAFGRLRGRSRRGAAPKCDAARGADRTETRQARPGTRDTVLAVEDVVHGVPAAAPPPPSGTRALKRRRTSRRRRRQKRSLLEAARRRSRARRARARRVPRTTAREAGLSDGDPRVGVAPRSRFQRARAGRRRGSGRGGRLAAATGTPPRTCLCAELEARAGGCKPRACRLR